MWHAELVSTGEELLNGRTVNTHAQVLGRRLGERGIALVRDTTVPDDLDVIRAAVSAALERAPLVFVTGGLGPTSDDVTRDAVAKLLGRGIVLDEAARLAIRERWSHLPAARRDIRDRQAAVVAGSVVLPNSVGAAPGMRLELGEKTLFLLPGPSLEFEAILQEHVLPWLDQRLGPARPGLKIFTIAGIGESDIVARFEAAGFPLPGIQVAYCANPGVIEVRLSAAPDSGADLDAGARAVHAALGRCVVAEERVAPEEFVGRLLSARPATLAVAESCTGGLLGHKLTLVDGSSKYFLGGVIAYANQVKVELLGVDAAALRAEGAVSAAVARQMAAGARRCLHADFGLGITGIAGPAGGTPVKPVGLVYIALADAAGSYARRFLFKTRRAWVKEMSANAALDMLRRHLLGAGGEETGTP